MTNHSKENCSEDIVQEPAESIFMQIHGMGGIGRMALAKVVCNKQNYLVGRKYPMRTGVGKSSEAGKSSNVSSVIEYDVFLSFRGLDTRQGFADCLYHVIRGANTRVFLDEEELHVGEEIRDKLRRAIKNSKIYVPILSKNYASSPSCLLELAHMVECKKSKPFEKMILPIFYDVKPRDVMLKSQLYVGALAKHEEKFGQKTMRAWEDALRNVAQIKGWELKRQGYVGVLKHSINFCFGLAVYTQPWVSSRLGGLILNE